MVFIPISGDDNGIRRTITFISDAEEVGTRNIEFVSLETAANHVPEIRSVTPSISLAHRALYRIDILYNVNGESRQGNSKFIVVDKITDAPQILLPRSSTALPLAFQFRFQKSEVAAEGTLRLKFDHIGGAPRPKWDG